MLRNRSQRYLIKAPKLNAPRFPHFCTLPHSNRSLRSRILRLIPRILGLLSQGIRSSCLIYNSSRVVLLFEIIHCQGSDLSLAFNRYVISWMNDWEWLYNLSLALDLVSVMCWLQNHYSWFLRHQNFSFYSPLASNNCLNKFSDPHFYRFMFPKVAVACYIHYTALHLINEASS